MAEAPPDDLTAPSLADFERMARAAYDALPQVFRQPCEGLLIRVADFADDDLLAGMRSMIPSS